jgi:hypothetical protein
MLNLQTKPNNVTLFYVSVYILKICNFARMDCSVTILTLYTLVALIDKSDMSVLKS